MKVTVGILSHNPGKLFERCMESLIRVSAGIEYELKLQLTGGSNAENWNRLYKRVDEGFLCILEDDTAALRPFWLRSLVDTLRVLTKCGIVMPIETKNGIDPDQGFVKWLNKTADVGATYGFCNVIRTDVGLEADENLTYFVDIDLAQQAIRKGWTCAVNGHVWMLHGGNEARMSNDPDIRERQEKDREYLSQKWGKEFMA